MWELFGLMAFVYCSWVLIVLSLDRYFGDC
jgi:hypothetical protein